MNNIFTKSGKISVVFALVALLAFSVSAQLKLRNAVNYDTDNKADFSVFRPSDNTWYIAKSGGGITIQNFGLANEDYPTPGDYDGDGRGDISVWRDTNGVWYRLNSSNNTFVATQFGLTGDEAIARDFDGDGKTDLAVVRRTNGNMIWYVLGSMVGFYGVQYGLSTDTTAPGDYDGDGKFDLAVQRPGATANGQSIFYIFRSMTNTLQVVQFGLSNDLNVPGDYDGDGKTDVAVVREGATANSNLSWFILRSSDGVFVSYLFGLSGSDLTTQNDYDGDGRTDVAVWRETNGTFYVLRSSDLGVTGFQWGTANDIPLPSYDTH